MFGFHISSLETVNPTEAVEYGFLAWALLIASTCIIFLAVALVKIFSKKKNKKTGES